nr:DUF1576 domain-containing protein [uncultured Butyricicoccus sp.]
MEPHAHTRYERMFLFLWGYAALLFVAGLVLGPPSKVLSGLVKIVLTEDALITDYVLVAGLGAALVNAAIVTAISLLILHAARVPANGITLVVIGLMSGFSLFGKNFVNIWPILLGTWLYAKSRREPFGKYAATGLMGTALAPVVSYFVLDNGWGTLPTGILVGAVIGFILPALSAYTYKVQNGMNLYNIGFACGLIAVLIVPLISSLGATPTTQYRWATGQAVPFAVLLGGLSLALLAGGLFGCKPKPSCAWRGYLRLLRTSGRAPSDYLRMFGPAPTLINAGINGLIGLGMIALIGGDLNGPTVGGILTIIGFSAFGKHARNILPVMCGVLLGSLIMHWSLSDSAVQLACLFCTTLAPISGYFGWPYGVLAGFIHASVVLYTGSPVAGMNLYNNGFSGGLVAIVLYAIVIAVIRHRRPEIQDEDYFDLVADDEPTAPKTAYTLTEKQE